MKSEDRQQDEKPDRTNDWERDKVSKQEVEDPKRTRDWEREKQESGKS
jgi:hypothetical protein